MDRTQQILYRIRLVLPSDLSNATPGSIKAEVLAAEELLNTGTGKDILGTGPGGIVGIAVGREMANGLRRLYFSTRNGTVITASVTDQFGRLDRPVLVVEPRQLTFGRSIVGQKQTQTLMLSNAGTRALVGTVGTLPAPFTLVEGRGSFSLARGQSWNVTVEFAPTVATGIGKFQAILAVISNDPDAAAVLVPVSGESVATGSSARLSVSPSPQEELTLRVTGRDLVYGECKEGKLLLRNEGVGLLRGSVGELREPFTLIGDGEFELLPGQSKTVIVRFCAQVGRLPGKYETRVVILIREGEPARVEIPVRIVPP